MRTRFGKKTDCSTYLITHIFNDVVCYTFVFQINSKRRSKWVEAARNHSAHSIFVCCTHTYIPYTRCTCATVHICALSSRALNSRGSKLTQINNNKKKNVHWNEMWRVREREKETVLENRGKASQQTQVIKFNYIFCILSAFSRNEPMNGVHQALPPPPLCALYGGRPPHWKNQSVGKMVGAACATTFQQLIQMRWRAHFFLVWQIAKRKSATLHECALHSAGMQAATTVHCVIFSSGAHAIFHRRGETSDSYQILYGKLILWWMQKNATTITKLHWIKWMSRLMKMDGEKI